MEQIATNPTVIWFLVGLVLLLAELAVPGLIIVFFGIGAWVAAVCCLVFDISINEQLLIFLISSLLSLALLRRLIRQRYMNRQEDHGGDINEDYLGKTVVALTDFDDQGTGKVAFKGTTWEASSAEPISRGQNAIITGFQSIRLQVKPLPPHNKS